MLNNVEILVVDDDKNISQLIKLYLSKEGCNVKTAFDGKEAIEVFKSMNPDAVILDIMLPGMDGWDVCREIRKVSNVPIIMLTAKSETFDKVLGLELGADDFVVKPFEPKELLARIKAILRRTRQTEDKVKNIIEYPGLTINMEDYTVTFLQERLELPPKELELLFFLSAHPNKVYTREELLEHVWGFDYYGDSRTVDVHIKRLREKLTGNEVWQIKTVWGVGYKFEVIQ